jgi:hypothetical protein
LDGVLHFATSEGPSMARIADSNMLFEGVAMLRAGRGEFK